MMLTMQKRGEMEIEKGESPACGVTTVGMREESWIQDKNSYQNTSCSHQFRPCFFGAIHFQLHPVILLGILGIHGFKLVGLLIGVNVLQHGIQFGLACLLSITQPMPNLYTFIRKLLIYTTDKYSNPSSIYIQYIAVVAG